MKIVSGSASEDLAKSDGELRIIIPKVQDKKVIVIQSLSPPVNDNLIELLLILDALKRMKIKEIVAFSKLYHFYPYGLN